RMLLPITHVPLARSLYITPAASVVVDVTVALKHGTCIVSMSTHIASDGTLGVSTAASAARMSGEPTASSWPAASRAASVPGVNEHAPQSIAAPTTNRTHLSYASAQLTRANLHTSAVRCGTRASPLPRR